MTTAICCIIKDEQAFIREFVEYHLALGIDHIYLFEDYGSRSHAPQVGDLPRCTLRTLGGYGIEYVSGSARQYNLYEKFLAEAPMSGINWVLFNDVDEFMMFEDGWDLARLTEEYKDVPAVWLSWKNYGACGRIKKPECGVMEAYPYPAAGKPDKSECWNFKSLVNTAKCSHMATLHEAEGGVHTDGATDRMAPQSYKKAWLNHYFTKSWEDYCDRMLQRGNLSNSYRSFDNFFLVNPDMLPMRDELLAQIPRQKGASSMWISKELGLIFGGNLADIEYIENQLKTKKQ